MENLGENVSKALSDNSRVEDILGESPFTKLLNETASAASCRPDMLLLPVLTTVSGLMNISVCRTHRDEISFEEPNIIWSCVAATPGKFDVIILA